MSDLILIKPRCMEPAKTKRLNAILEESLCGYTYDTITTAAELKDLQNKKILFAVSLGESGINLEFYRILKEIRLNSSCLEESIGSIIIDGNSELFTKSVARELIFSANTAGCTFPGKALVEGTKTLDNFNVVAKNLETDNLSAYIHSGKTLVQQLMHFDLPKKETPKLLVLHASHQNTSNTLNLWNMVKKHLIGCDINEISIQNGTVMDCIGCPYKMCRYFGQSGGCIYGGVIVDRVYPALVKCDALIMICPNYNDALGANLAAFINRLTALIKMTTFYDKYLFSLIVSGYSGSDIVAQQLVSGLNVNKTFLLPSRFAMMETALNPGRIYELEGIETRAAAFAENILRFTKTEVRQ